MSRVPATHSSRLRVAYFCSRFPHRTETFIQREVRALGAHEVDFEVFSLWGGSDSFEGRPVRRFRMWELFALLWWLPYWLIRRPVALLRGAEAFFDRGPPTVVNFLENALGFGVAVVWAARIRRTGFTHLHAVWASLPATAAWMLAELLDLSWSMGAHAYDVFQNGGDWLLEHKLRHACFVQTSSESSRRRLLEAGAYHDSLVLIRRGLNEMPQMSPVREDRRPLRILSVGRLVEKMGYLQELQVLSALQQTGLSFEARIAGDGPLRRRIEAAVERLGLGRSVELLGHVPFEEVLDQLAWADVLLFCGVVARDGDRAGVPNIIAEAMAAGTPVIASDVGGVREVIEHGVNGWIGEGPGAVEGLQRIAEDDELVERLVRNGRAWVETHFDAAKNAATLVRAMKAAVKSRPRSRRAND